MTGYPEVNCCKQPIALIEALVPSPLCEERRSPNLECYRREKPLNNGNESR